MGTIILPDHHLVRHPLIIRRREAPILVNGGVITEERDFKLVVFYREDGPGHPAEEIFAVAMNEDDFARSLIVASVDYLPGLLTTMRRVH